MKRLLLVLLPLIFLLQPVFLRAQKMAEVVYKVYPYCANSNDPRNTLEDVQVTVYFDRKLLRPTGGFFKEDMLHSIRVLADPSEGFESSKGKFFIKKIEWMKCAAGVNGTPAITKSQSFKSTEVAMTVNIDPSGDAKNCYKAVIYVEKCGGTIKVEEAKVKLITTATRKAFKDELPTDKIAIMVGNEKLPVDADGTGFVKLPNKKITFRVQWNGEGMSDPGRVTIRNSKTNSTLEVPRIPNRIAYIHEYAVDLSQYAGTENLYDYEIRVNMEYQPRGAVNEVRAVGIIPGVSAHKAGTPEDNWITLEPDMVLQQGDEISCDPDGAVMLQFADNSTVIVRNTTQLKIASFFTEGGVVKTEILLKMGEVAAKVHKSEATKSDFRIKPPSGPGSVRGTIFSMRYDPATTTTEIKVEEGIVDFTPEKNPVGKITLKTGQQARIVGNKIDPIQPFTGKIDLALTGKPVTVTDPVNDLSGTWLLTQGTYKGRLTIRKEGNGFSGNMEWDNHQKAIMEPANLFGGSILFVLAYDNDLRGNYNGKLDATGKRLEGECISNKGTSDRWTAVRQ